MIDVSMNPTEYCLPNCPFKNMQIQHNISYVPMAGSISADLETEIGIFAECEHEKLCELWFNEVSKVG